MFPMPKNLILIFPIFFFTSDVFAQRLLLCLSNTDILLQKENNEPVNQYYYNTDKNY